MLSKHELEVILKRFTDGINSLFEEKLKGVILFGSYLRGDFDEESDIDVMVIVDIDSGDLHKYRTLVTNVADKADWDFETLLSPIIVSHSEFEQNKDSAPFYSSVYKEGVNLIG